MLSCRDLAHRHASDYIDGNLGLRARVGVWYHLWVCENCRRFVAQMRKVRTLLRDKPDYSSPIATDDVQAQQVLGEQLADIYAKQKNENK